MSASALRGSKILLRQQQQQQQARDRTGLPPDGVRSPPACLSACLPAPCLPVCLPARLSLL